MPAAFIKCVKEGGRVRRIIPKKGVYLNICYPKGGGSPVRGEIHHYESNPGTIPIIDEELKGAGYSGGVGLLKPRRLGRPLTDGERRERHKRLYGTSKLPPRGTGLLAEASKLMG